jgi:hypothetical protein
MAEKNNKLLTWSECVDPDNHWTRTNDEDKYFVMTHPVHGRRNIARSELDNIDPKLALFLDVHAAPFSNGSGRNVYFTMRLWRRERSIPIDDYSVRRDQFVDRIRMVLEVNHDTDVVVIEADTIKVAGSPGLQCVPEYGMAQIVAIKFDVLEDFYPGCIGRLQAGVAIGMKANDLVEYMSNSPLEAHPATLPADISPENTC